MFYESLDLISHSLLEGSHPVQVWCVSSYDSRCLANIQGAQQMWGTILTVSLLMSGLKVQFPAWFHGKSESLCYALSFHFVDTKWRWELISAIRSHWFLSRKLIRMHTRLTAPPFWTLQWGKSKGLTTMRFSSADLTRQLVFHYPIQNLPILICCAMSNNF